MVYEGASLSLTTMRRPAPRGLGDISPAGWRNIARRLGRGAKRHHASVVSAGVAFFGFLSLFPALAAVVATYGLLADPDDVRKQVDVIGAGMPEEIRGVLQVQLARLIARSSGTLSLEVAVGIVLAVWAATKGTKSLITALTMAFEQPETRGHLKMAVVAFGFTAGGISMGVIAVAAMIALPVVLGHLGLSSVSAALIRWLRWPTLAGVLLGSLAVAYRYGPPRRCTTWRWLTPGSVAATALWLIGSGLFSWFAPRFAGRDLDGTLGAIVLLLGWFLLSAYAVIFGAELDAEIERQTRDGPRGSKVSERTRDSL
jgi:membrane protein